MQIFVQEEMLIHNLLKNDISSEGKIMKKNNYFTISLSFPQLQILVALFLDLSPFPLKQYRHPRQ